MILLIHHDKNAHLETTTEVVIVDAVKSAADKATSIQNQEQVLFQGCWTTVFKWCWIGWGIPNLVSCLVGFPTHNPQPTMVALRYITYFCLQLTPQD